MALLQPYASYEMKDSKNIYSTQWYGNSKYFESNVGETPAKFEDNTMKWLDVRERRICDKVKFVFALYRETKIRETETPGIK